MSGFERVKLDTDINYFHKVFIHFCEKSTHQTAQIKWLQTGFARDVVTKLSDVQSGEELRTLGIGSGEGELECELLKSLLQKFPRITNHTIEPSENQLNQYKHRIQNDVLHGVTFHWNTETIQSFRQRSETNGNMTKFHFISALNSLYYVDDIGKWLDYLYDDLLEDGGTLMVILTTDTSGQGYLNKEYLLHDGWFDTSQKSLPDRDSSGLTHDTVENHFKKRGIHYENVIVPVQCDITECFDVTNPTPESDLLLDFFSNIINFRQNVENKVFKQFLDVLGSDVCSVRSNGKVLLSYDNGVTIVTKR